MFIWMRADIWNQLNVNSLIYKQSELKLQDEVFHLQL